MVQGVGFRYMTVSFARDLGLAGWVKNLPDGRVEIIAEGKKEDIDLLIHKIENHFQGYIKNKDIQLSPAEGTLKEFHMAY